MTGPWRFDIAMMMMWLLGVENVYEAPSNEGCIVIDSLQTGDAHE